MIKNNGELNGITYSWDGDWLNVSGTSTDVSFRNILISTGGVFPDGRKLTDLKQLIFEIERVGNNITSDNTSVAFYIKTGDNQQWHNPQFVFADAIVDVSSAWTDILIRLRISSGATVAGKVKVTISDRMRGLERIWENQLVKTGNKAIPTGTDLNDINENIVGLCMSDSTYVNYPLPAGRSGVLFNIWFGNFTHQIVIPYSSEDKSISQFMYRTRSYGTWHEWYYAPVSSHLIQTHDNLASETGFSDLNEVIENGIYWLNKSTTYINTPNGFSMGFFASFRTGNWIIQLLWPYTGGTMWKRRGHPNGTAWEEWQMIAAPSNNLPEKYYLASTDDETDRTQEILAILSNHGICRLGAGTYYINGLEMPNWSSLIGCGNATKIYLSGNSDGFAIKPGNNCTLKDFVLIGASETPAFGEVAGGRHGILWQGTYTENEQAPMRCILDSIYIYNFTGGGITGYDTGSSSYCSIEGTNLYIWRCWAGLNISYYSEYHKFTNVHCRLCRIGCVNNGGNNIFVNCDFTSNQEIGMLIDDSMDQSPNNSHGACIGCQFNHTRSGGVSNSGVGIKILGCDSGFVFSGCQIFYSKIQIENSPGIIFSNCLFGLPNCDIQISGGTGILFIGNSFKDRPVITIENNAGVHFANCYSRTTGALIEL